MGKTIKAKFAPLHQLADKLAALSLRDQTAVLRSGISKAAEPVVRAAKANVADVNAIDTGALQKSLTKRVRTYRQGDYFFAAIGPDTGYYSGASRRRYARGENPSAAEAKREKLRRPSKYAHLIEFGHVSAEGYGPGEHFWEDTKGTRRRVHNTFPIRSFNGPRPFLFPAFQASLSTIDETLASSAAKAMDAAFKKAFGA